MILAFDPSNMALHNYCPSNMGLYKFSCPCERYPGDLLTSSRIWLSQLHLMPLSQSNLQYTTLSAQNKCENQTHEDGWRENYTQHKTNSIVNYFDRCHIPNLVSAVDWYSKTFEISMRTYVTFQEVEVHALPLFLVFETWSELVWQKQKKTNMRASKLNSCCFLYLLNQHRSSYHLSVKTRRTESFYFQGASSIVLRDSNDF